jgi:hypothetical protein
VRNARGKVRSDQGRSFRVGAACNDLSPRSRHAPRGWVHGPRLVAAAGEYEVPTIWVSRSLGCGRRREDLGPLELAARQLLDLVAAVSNDVIRGGSPETRARNRALSSLPVRLRTAYKGFERNGSPGVDCPLLCFDWGLEVIVFSSDSAFVLGQLAGLFFGPSSPFHVLPARPV